MSANPSAIKKSAEKCPICKAPACVPFTPFCSNRCAKIDLGHWLDERYTIPTEEASPSPLPPSDEQ